MFKKGAVYDYSSRQELIILPEDDIDIFWEENGLGETVELICDECGRIFHYSRRDFDDINNEFSTEEDICLDCEKQLEEEYQDYVAQVRWDYRQGSGV